jgi:hypothetical protein
MACHNICVKIYSKIVVGESHYTVGKRYCRRCECYFVTDRKFCQCCGMHPITPSESEYKEKIRENLIAVSKKNGTGRNSLSRKGSRY